MIQGDSLEVTELLQAWASGDHGPHRLATAVCEELRRMARSYMRNERARNTFRPLLW
jgi:hypothetical protein